MFPGEYVSWQDPDASWNVKLRQAKRHIDHLATEVKAFRESIPYTITPEKTDIPGQYAYRIHRHSIPAQLSAVVGDVLHNLRGALESIPYEIARQGQGGKLRPEQERATTFPIFETPKEFTAFFTHPQRQLLYDQQARDALRSVQPFAHVETVFQDSADLEEIYKRELTFSPLFRLHVLWNIDKHRRLTLMDWRLKLAYWFGDDSETEPRFMLGDGQVEDGAIVFHMEGNDGAPATDVKYEFVLSLADDPAFIDNPHADEDILDLLTSWHRYIAQTVLPNVFFVPAPGPLSCESGTAVG